MKMKYDYYNHTNVFKPGYNVQFGISDGFIRNVYLSSDCNDLPTYIPFMEKYYQAYGEYLEKTPADAGYGSYDNYMFCKKHEIDLYMKYSGYYKEQEKRQKRINSRYLKCGRKMEVMCVHRDINLNL
ncbi:transposase [Coprobacillaceae bacterium CR2/5/TPMF4]|nr:transposase [Coprobacillaceae bacterium CR2/5/TPMF4]